MYIPRAILILFLVIYLLFLLSIDWINSPAGHWYRPFFVAVMIVIAGALVHRGQDTDEF